MKMVKTWQQFNESYEDSKDQKDLEAILNYIAQNIPSSEISNLKKDLTPLLTTESLNEGLFSAIKDRLIKWFDEKIMNYMVNKKKRFYTELIGKLDLFDLTTLNDIKDNFRSFELNSLYLAGGMDKAKDVGAGWRSQVEYEFEVVNKGVPYEEMEKITIPYQGQNIVLKPAYVVDGDHLVEFVDEGNNYSLKYYDRPAILNPVRKEMDRTKNPNFGKEMGKFKSGEYEDAKDPRQFDEISRIFSQTIEPEDELIVNKCDAVFVGFNEATSGGTFGELQQTSFLNKPIFAWYIDGWKISGHSPWNLPHVSKIMRTDEDMKLFVKTMVNFEK